MITLAQFSSLPFKVRAQYTQDHGKLLICRNGNERLGKLYALDDFFVELWYEGEKNRLVEVVASGDLKQIAEYLELVPLDDLF